MAHTGVLDRPGTLAGDGEEALIAAMRRDWPAYVIDVDGRGTWWALRRDGRKAVSGRLPVTLLAAIIADHDTRPPADTHERAAPGTPVPGNPAAGETPGAAPAGC